MKNATSREQLGKEIIGTDFRYYQNISESVKDFILWLNYTNFPESIFTLSEYVDELKKRHYFEETSYSYLKLMKAYYVSD